MRTRRSPHWIVVSSTLLALAASPAWARGDRDHDGGSRGGSTSSARPRDALSSVRHWNQIAIDASGLDHAPPAPGEEPREFFQQIGPGRASRAMAIVQIAVFDAMNATEGRYHGYTDLPRVHDKKTSVQAAIAQAAHDTLVALYPAQTQSLDEALDEDLRRIPRGREKSNGIELGHRAAAAILSLREGDGSDHDEPLVDVDWLTSDEPGRWRKDPESTIPFALGAHWGGVEPFVLESADQFRAPVPPELDSPEYTQAFDEVKRLGGDGVTTPTERSDRQTFIGIYWAYDGLPRLCAPPRLYNQITTEIARKMKTKALELARLYALVNLAMADTGITTWESKYYYDYWRPITGIREADPDTGPTGAGDGNGETLGDIEWTPLGAPNSNAPDATPFTPPFPAYPSGHAAFGGALFQTLRRFYGRDRIDFTFVSDEWNGETVGSDGRVRPRVPRHFRSLSQAEEENGQSRIYLGIHWAFDKTAGIAQGRRVADYVFEHAFTPLRQSERAR